MSQVFERVLKVRLVGFLEKERLITPGQYGFRAGHSTAMAVLDMVEKVRAAWGRGNVALGVFIDLKKASCWHLAVKVGALGSEGGGSGAAS